MVKFHYGSTANEDLLYLLRYQISDPFFYLQIEEQKIVFLNVLERDAFLAHNQMGIEVVSYESVRQGSVAETAIHILKQYKVAEITVPTTFPLALADELRAAGITVSTTDDWCPERRTKTKEEIAAIRSNFEHTIEAYRYVEAVLRESVIVGSTLEYRDRMLTSEWLKQEVKKLLLDYDLETPAGIVIAGGKQASEPHNQGSGPLRPGETIVVDIFPQSTVNHLFADMTRTYVKGVPLHKEVNKMYEAVAASQENACKALRPGVACSMPYEISAGIIERAGFDVGEVGYTHSLGHGLGVGIHEAPNLSPGASGTLAVGDVVTVEPGLYYPQWGGVRLEDTVVITEDGYENLTQYETNWIID